MASDLESDAMFLLLVSAAAVLQQAPPTIANITVTRGVPPAGCLVAGPVPTAGPAPQGEKKLGDLPPAREFHPVIRSYKGCDLAEVRGVGPDGQAAWVLEPTGPGHVEKALPTGNRIKRPDAH